MVMYCTARILFLCVVNSEGMPGYCSAKRSALWPLQSYSFSRSCIFRRLLLTLHQFNISTLVLETVLLRHCSWLFVVLTGLALLESLVSDPAISSGQELLDPSGN